MEPTPHLSQPAKLIADPDGIGGALGLLHGAADLVVVLASLLIAGLLVYLYQRRPDLRLRRLFALFALFILASAASHLAYWVRPLGGGLGCLLMILFSVLASILLTVLLNVVL